MQTRKRRTETISETNTLVILRSIGNGQGSSWCSDCSADVHWITPDALTLFGITELPTGKTMHKRGEDVCSRSLVQTLDTGENYE